MRSWSPWFARNVAYVRKQHDALPKVGAVVKGVDPEKITDAGWKAYIEKRIADHELVEQVVGG